MSTVTRRRNGHALAQTLETIPHVAFEDSVDVVVPCRRARPHGAMPERLRLPYVFAETVLRYLLRISPYVTSELAHWRARAEAIPDPTLRRHAHDALRKRGNIEGAALFAVLVPASERRRTVRALVAYQTAYNYLDALSEQPSEDPAENGRQLHQALIAALGRVGSESPHPDYYAHNPQGSDGGYLPALVDACRGALARLPSYPAVRATAVRAALRIVEFQARNLNEPQGGHRALQAWAVTQTPATSGLEWWETAAAAGSSLAVYTLIAAAADPAFDSSDAGEIDRAYFPWTGALHSLLDSLVDRREDDDGAQRCLLDYYPPAQSAVYLASLAIRARRSIQRLPSPHAHRVVLTAMCSYYLSAPECYTAEARSITHGLTDALGPPLPVAIAMFRSRRLAATLRRRSYT